MGGSHARLSPSAAHRWVRCPASVRRIEELAKRVAAAGGAVLDLAGRAAAEGTAFHHFVETLIKSGADPASRIGKMSLSVEFFEDNVIKRETFVFGEEMALHARRALGYVDELILSGLTVETERRVAVELGRTRAWGTADVVAYSHQPAQITVVDWKYGAGVPVQAEENYQLLLYAAAAIETCFPAAPDRSTVEMVIYQPRVSRSYSSWTLTAAEVRKRIAEEVVPAAESAVFDDNAPAEPGDVQCRWCPLPAHNACPEYARSHLDMVSAALGDVLQEPPSGLSPDEAARVLRSSASIRKWLDLLHEWAVREHLAGRPLPGMKLVEGRRRSMVKDKGRLVEVLERAVGDAAFEKKPLGLTTLRKLLGERYEELVGPCVGLTAPKFMLVDAADKRPGVALTLDDVNRALDSVGGSGAKGEKGD